MTLDEAVAIVKPHNDKIVAESKLDLAWERINALGGSDQQNNSYDQGWVDAIGKALEAIEKLGGSDPLLKRNHR
jgi:hypothetical protein